MEENADRQEVVNPRRRWLYVQRLVLEVWRRWLKELVPRLNVRAKWRGDKRKVEVGDVLLVVKKDTPRGKWPLGRVSEVFPGPDGVVRVVDVVIQGKTYRRAVHNLIPLEVTDDEQAVTPASVPATCSKGVDEVSAVV